MSDLIVNKVKETRTITKLFLVYDFEKEEQWLNEMAEEGWALISVSCGFVYHFEKCEPGEYIIRIELNNKGESYVSFLEEMNAECVGKYINWIYMRRKSELGKFELFSDIDSKIKHLDLIGKMITVAGIFNIIIGVCNSLMPAKVGWINLLVSTLLMYCLGRIHSKKETLVKERNLHE